MRARISGIFFIIALSFFAANLSARASLKGGEPNTAPGRADEVFNRNRLNFLEFKFGDALERIGARAGAICIVRSGKVIFEKTIALALTMHSSAPGTSAGASDILGDRYFPLGRTSEAFVSLLAVAMENSGKISLSSKVSSRCSFFRSFGGLAQEATFADLLSCRAGIPLSADSLIPDTSSSEEFFQVLAQIPLAAPPGEISVRSKASVSAAGYALAYIENPSEKNMKKSFASAAKKYLFSPLGISARYRSFNKAHFPATAFSLSSKDIAKWLSEETSPSPRIATGALMQSRRQAPGGGSKFGMGFTYSSVASQAAFICADYFENTANIVAFFPKNNIAVAFLVECSDAKKASKLCAEMLLDAADIIGKSDIGVLYNKSLNKGVQ